MKDGDALYSEFAESSVSFQGSNPFAEEATNIQAFPQARPAVVGMSSQGSDLSAEEATNSQVFFQLMPAEFSMSFQDFDPFSEQVTNSQVFPQARPAEFSMSFQDSDPFAEQVTNSQVFSQLMSAEFSMGFQGSDPFAEEATNSQVFSQARPAEFSMSFQDSDPFAEQVTNIPVFSQLMSADSSSAIAGTSFQGSNPSAEQVTNIPVFPQLMSADSSSAESSTSFQGSNPSAEEATNIPVFPQLMSADSSSAIADTSSQGCPSVRKKIKRTNGAVSSGSQQVQRKNADMAYSKRVCMDADKKELKINGRIIVFGPKEFVFVKLLFEKINTHVSIDNLYVAVYGGKAGDWEKDSKKERQRVYSLLTILREKLPKDCFEGDPSRGYMLSGSVMTSQGSLSAREEIKRTPAQNKMVCFRKIGIDIEKKELEIDGKSFVFKSQEFKVLKLLFEKINTYVSSDDLYVVVSGEDKSLPMASVQIRLYRLIASLRNNLFEDCIEDCIRGNSDTGYMLSNSYDLIDVSYQGFSAAPKRMEHTDDSDSSEASESEEDGDDLQKIQYDKKNSPLISNCYIGDYAQFIKDNESIRRRYIKVRKRVGFVRIGEVCISFRKKEFTIDGRNVFLSLREIQALRFLALWYPKVAAYEQIYYNLPFGIDEDYSSSSEKPEIKKIYLLKLINNVKKKLNTDRIRISNSYKGIGYRLVCHSKRQACQNESFVQDTLHSKSTGSSS
jgi:DNA-binding response OmpR family regulator